jgi:regulatory protein
MFAKKIVSFSNALEKIKNYCAYQERSHAEVKSKLFSWGLHTNEVNQIVAQVITENFLNEERYAKALVSGKFKIKKWGKNKIIAKLKFQNVSKYCINRGLLEIDEAEYKKTFLSLLIKKWELTKEINIHKKKGKVARFLIGRGYEIELVYSEINKLVND